MNNRLPEDGDWETVGIIVRRQLRQQRLPIETLSAKSGVSQQIIRAIGTPEKRNRTTVVSLAAAMGYRYDYLVDVLAGKAGIEEPGISPDGLMEKLDTIIDILLANNADD